jgi:hypothetical protein
VLRQTDGMEQGNLGAFLRREGLYSSILSTWRRQREAGVFKGLEPQRRGPKPTANADAEKQLATLEKENAKLHAQVRRLALVLDVQEESCCYAGRRPPSSEDRDCPGGCFDRVDRHRWAAGWLPLSVIWACHGPQPTDMPIQPLQYLRRPETPLNGRSPRLNEIRSWSWPTW